MMESSLGSGTPTTRWEKDDVTSTGLSSVPKGASSLPSMRKVSVHKTYGGLQARAGGECRTMLRGRGLCPLLVLQAPPCIQHQLNTCYAWPQLGDRASSSHSPFYSCGVLELIPSGHL